MQEGCAPYPHPIPTRQLPFFLIYILASMEYIVLFLKKH